MTAASEGSPRVSGRVENPQTPRPDTATPRAMSTLGETLGDFALVALVLVVGLLVTPWLASLV